MTNEDTDDMYRQIKHNVTECGTTNLEIIRAGKYITLDYDGWYKVHTTKPEYTGSSWVRADKHRLICYAHGIKGGPECIAPVNFADNPD